MEEVFTIHCIYDGNCQKLEEKIGKFLFYLLMGGGNGYTTT